MRKVNILVCAVSLVSLSISAQFPLHYDPERQTTGNIQYFKPAEEDLFVGDCIPFAHNGVFYLYWLIDKGHHTALNGLGAHQWTVSTTTDLVHWKHYPVVLGLDAEWEKSICTGSVIYADSLFYAYYATRVLQDGKKQEQLSYAISRDGIKFIKQEPNPFFTAPEGYQPSQFRDPKIISGREGYHMFISSYKTNPEIQQYGGCLAHLFSKDLKTWELREPVLDGQRSTPECADYFFWNGWYYLIYSIHGDGYYVKSRNPFGPWEYPRDQALKEPFANVPKTAEFMDNRRISAAWIPSLDMNNLNGRGKFGGNMVLREVVQEEDGTLGTKFPPELIPATSNDLSLPLKQDSLCTGNSEKLQINAPNGIGSAGFKEVPYNCRINLEIEILGNNDEYGLFLRAGENAQNGCRLSFSPTLNTVQLGNKSIAVVENLGKAISVDIIMKDDIIDVCVDDRRCIVNRFVQQTGDQLWLYAKQGNVLFKSIKIQELQ